MTKQIPARNRFVDYRSRGDAAPYPAVIVRTSTPLPGDDLNGEYVDVHVLLSGPNDRINGYNEQECRQLTAGRTHVPHWDGRGDRPARDHWSWPQRVEEPKPEPQKDVPQPKTITPRAPETGA
jgi:hypothetical protein